MFLSYTAVYPASANLLPLRRVCSRLGIMSTRLAGAHTGRSSLAVWVALAMPPVGSLNTLVDGAFPA